MAELQIPVELITELKGDTKAAAQIFEGVAKGSERAKERLLELTKQDYTLKWTAQFDNKGNVKQALKKQNDLINKIEQAYKKSNKAAAGSVTSLRQQVNTLKQSRDAVAKYDERTGKLRKEWELIDKEISSIQTKLKRLDSPIFQKVSKLSGGNQGFAALAMGASKAVPVIGQISAALESLGPIFMAIDSGVAAFVNRQKQIQGLKLSLKGFGASAEDINTVFAAASGIAMSYGVSLASVEKGYKRMTPTIIAAGGSIDDVGVIMASMSARMATLGLNSEQSQRYMEAFAQVMGKGKLQGEELNQQFAELDGSMKPMIAEFIEAKYGITDLEGAMQRGEISSAMFAEAVVSGSKEMRENLETDFNDIQSRIDGMTIAQIESTMKNLNTFSLENLGKQLAPIGKEIMALGLSFSQFFASLTSDGSLIAETLVGAINPVIWAFRLASEIVMVVVAATFKLIKQVEKARDAIKEWAMQNEFVVKTLNAVKSALGFFLNIWNGVKDAVMESDREMRNAKDGLDMTHKSTKEFTFSVQDLAESNKSLAGTSSETTAKILKLADSFFEAKDSSEGMAEVTYELTDAENRLLEATIKLIAKQDEMATTAANLVQGLGEQVRELSNSASGFEASGKSVAEYGAELSAVESLTNSQISATKKLIKEFMEREAATGQLSNKEKELLASAKKSLTAYTDMKDTLKTTKAEFKSYTDSLADASLELDQYLKSAGTAATAQEALTLSSSKQVQQNRDLSSSYQTAADALREKRAGISEMISKYDLSASAISRMTKEERKELEGLVNTAKAYDKKIKSYDQMAAKAAPVINSLGELSGNLRAELELLTSSSRNMNLNSREREALGQRTQALASIISSSLTAAESEYQDLLKIQISNVRALTVAEQQRIAMLAQTIDKLKNTKQQLDAVAESQKNGATATREQKTEWQRYREEISSTGTQMEFAIQRGQNLYTAINAVSGAMGRNSGGAYTATLNGVRISASQVTQAIDQQISALQGHIEKLESAAIAGIKLNEVEKGRLTTMKDMVQTLQKVQTEQEGANSKKSKGLPLDSQKVEIADSLNRALKTQGNRLVEVKQEMLNLDAAGGKATRRYAELVVESGRLEASIGRITRSVEGNAKAWGANSSLAKKASGDWGQALKTLANASVGVKQLDEKLASLTPTVNAQTAAQEALAKAAQKAKEAIEDEAQTMSGAVSSAKSLLSAMDGVTISSISTSGTMDDYVGSLNGVKVTGNALLGQINSQISALNSLETGLIASAVATGGLSSEQRTALNNIRSTTEALEGQKTALEGKAAAQAAAAEAAADEDAKAAEAAEKARERAQEAARQADEQAKARMQRMADGKVELEEMAMEKVVAITERANNEISKLQEHASSDFADQLEERLSNFMNYTDRQIENVKIAAAKAASEDDLATKKRLENQAKLLERVKAVTAQEIALIQKRALEAVKRADLVRDKRIEAIEQERAALDRREQAIASAMDLEERAAEEKKQSIQDALDVELQAIDRGLEAARSAMEGRLHLLDGEHSAILRNSSARIAELQALTPAEKKLEQMRIKELQDKAKDLSLDEKSRLEAQAQLERMQAQAKIQKEQEKIEKERARLEKEKAEAEQEAAKKKLAIEKELNAVRTKTEGELDDIQERRAALEDAANKANMDFLMKEKEIRSQMLVEQEEIQKQMIENVKTLSVKSGQEMSHTFEGVMSTVAGLRQSEHKNEMSRIAKEYQQRLINEQKLAEQRASLARNFSTTAGNRFAGGPVSGGTAYTVNELGKEGFMDRMGNMRQINAPAFGSWRAPSSGTVIPAHIWSEVKASQGSSVAPGVASSAAAGNSGGTALLRALAGLSGGSQDTITNNVTIQSDQPIQAASDVMVQMAKIRHRRLRG